MGTMNGFHALLLAALVQAATTGESCLGGFCAPSRKQLPTPEELAQSQLIYHQGGCGCREIPNYFTVCYGHGTCRTFPNSLNMTTSSFQLKETRIAQLNRGDFSSMAHLITLNIEGNFDLVRISSGSFFELRNLQNLSLSYNSNLNQLETGSFTGLINLEVLFLVKNGFESIKALTPALVQLPKLYKLDLSENHFPQVNNDDFEEMSNSTLSELNLILCQIEDVESEAFTPLRNLRALRLGENSFNITTLNRVLEETLKRVPLRLLNLYSTGLKKNEVKPLLSILSHSNITNVCLARNQIEVLNSDTLPSMPNLVSLDLREVFLLNVTKDAFSKLTNLKTLHLNGNKLSSIPDGFLLEELTYLDLQENSGTDFRPSYFSIQGNKFTKMKKLEYLNLGYNSIHAIYNDSFEGLQELKILGLKNATLYHIANRSFVWLENLVFLNLENNGFARGNRSVLGPELFYGLANLKVLLLGGCGIGFFDKYSKEAFTQLPNLEHLGLERNNLVSALGIELLPNLITLDLSSNRLQQWQTRIFVNNSKLQQVQLTRNKFSFVSKAMLEDFSNLTSLDLRENPFTCDCSFTWNEPSIMNLIVNQSVFCAFPESTSNLTIPEFLLTLPSCRHTTKFISLLPIVILLILLVIIFSLLYYYRWYLRYWIFLARLYLSRKGKINRKPSSDSYTNYLYDAFVSYSNEDHNFVIRLVTMLENYPPYLKLCVYERDFQVGTMISENVLESVARSRKTLLIISDSYAKSQWCRWESQIAEHHRLFFHNENGQYVDDSLILIKLGPVSENHLTPTLKFLLKTRIYLQWDTDAKKQRLFWEKLRNTLTPLQEINENTYL